MSLITRILAPTAYSNRDDADHHHHLMSELTAIGTALDIMTADTLFTPFPAAPAGAESPYFLAIIDPSAMADDCLHACQDAAEETQRLFRDLFVRHDCVRRYGMDDDPFGAADDVWTGFVDYINAQVGPGTLVIITPTEAQAGEFGSAAEASFCEIADLAVTCGLLGNISWLQRDLVQSLTALHQLTGIASKADLENTRTKLWGFLNGAPIGEVQS